MTAVGEGESFYLFPVVVVVVALFSVGMLSIISGNGLFLDAFDAVLENPSDDLFGLFVAFAVGVEIRLPQDDRAVRLVVYLKPELRLVVLHGQRAFDDLVGIGEILGAGQLLLDLTTVLERERAESYVALFGLLAFGNSGMPILDGTKLSDDRPDLRGKAGGLGSLLDR